MLTTEGKPRFFRREDGDLSPLRQRRVALIGYGNLGRVFALNLRDSGVADLIVGNIDDEYKQRALEDGFVALPISQAVANADISFIMLPDEVQPQVYASDIAPRLRSKTAVVFASGYNLAFGLIKPAQNIDVLLLAPRMIGAGVRDLYLSGKGYFSFVSVEQDASGQAWPVLLALARAVGTLAPGGGALELDATREAQLDLFGEQAFGPYIGSAIMNAFQVGVEAGMPPEAMVIEFYMSGEMARTFQAMADMGFFSQVAVHGHCAQYGGFIRTMALDQAAMAEKMRQVMDEIKSGQFASQFQKEMESGYPSLKLVQQMYLMGHPISRAEDSVRSNLDGAQTTQDLPSS